MTYLITDACIGTMDRSCLEVCPVDCIHEAERMLVIDPHECIDCGACESECPAEAIVSDRDLPEALEPWRALGELLATGDLNLVNMRVQELHPE
jgi:NAD-dependent dihydropyrimidine dehydrogenase PreA subunit